HPRHQAGDAQSRDPLARKAGPKGIKKGDTITSVDGKPLRPHASCEAGDGRRHPRHQPGDAQSRDPLARKAGPKGIKKGDTITSVDGKPLRSFDDAADLYARMPAAKHVTVVLTRGTKLVTLKVAI